MKMKVRMIVAALCAVGVVAPAVADTITPTTVVPPLAQPVSAQTTYTVTYPVTVQLTGGQPQTVNFVYSCAAASGGTTCGFTPPAGWTQTSVLNQNSNTVTFSTTQGNVTYGIAISATGAGFSPAQGTTPTTVPPSVGVALTNVPVTSP